MTRHDRAEDSAGEDRSRAAAACGRGARCASEADNLVGIYAALAGLSREAALDRFAGQNFSTFKEALSIVSVEVLGRIGGEMRRLMADRTISTHPAAGRIAGRGNRGAYFAGGAGHQRRVAAIGVCKPAFAAFPIGDRAVPLHRTLPPYRAAAL